MPQSGFIVRVLVASPADCVEERRLVPDVIHAWNAAHSLSRALILEPVLWELHARPEIGSRPQEIINEQMVDNCDILIGTFWTRLGTPTGAAQSGTTEEIERFRNTGKPVLLYFSSVPVDLDKFDAEQYQHLTEYRRQLSQDGLCAEYETIDKLRQVLSVHLAGTMDHANIADRGIAGDYSILGSGDPLKIHHIAENGTNPKISEIQLGLPV